jgi:hypothetical protein
LFIPLLKWFVLGIGAVASGALFIQSLTAHPVRMGRYQWTTAASLFAITLALILGFRGLKLWIALPVTGILARANAHLDGVDKSEVGVLLVGHGQPNEWDETWPTETAHEIAFRQNVLEQFKQDGYRPENLSLAWMEFKLPKPAPKIKEFVRNGVKRPEPLVSPEGTTVELVQAALREALAHSI